MWRNLTVNLADLLFSVSEAMDLSDSSLVHHQIRTAFVSSELARAARLDYDHIERLFVAALLHDIGALSPEEKIRVHLYEDLRPEPHCLRGGKLFREAFWLEPSAQIIDWHHTTIKTHHNAGRSLDDFDVLGSQILYLADHLERAIQRDTFILHQTNKLSARIHELAGDAIHPDVVALFDEISVTDHFWLTLVSKDLGRQLHERNLLRSIDLDYQAAHSIASVFKDMTDFRSRFTATHSTGVASCARGIAEALAFAGKDLQQIELAGVLHDIGKLVVPNAILCKPTRLTAEEYAVIRQHPYYTHRILSRVRGFEQIAEWASYHHERLDGSGYCERLGRTELDVGAKVVAVADIAIAIAERRPYRTSGDEATVLNELLGMSRKGMLEGQIVEALADNFKLIMTRAKTAQEADETRYANRYAMIV
ncbi:MAG TPA: HD domain-containing phosphohydrolase [Burkholderiaceae bacterium]|nr:HD domain-containing phosphohydrolase [Burkholderiaceae bacterium]